MDEDHGAALLPWGQALPADEYRCHVNALMAERDAAIARAELAEEQRDKVIALLREWWESPSLGLGSGDFGSWLSSYIPRVAAALSDEPKEGAMSDQNISGADGAIVVRWKRRAQSATKRYRRAERDLKRAEEQRQGEVCVARTHAQLFR